MQENSVQNDTVNFTYYQVYILYTHTHTKREMHQIKSRADKIATVHIGILCYENVNYSNYIYIYPDR